MIPSTEWVFGKYLFKKLITGWLQLFPTSLSAKRNVWNDAP